MIIPKNALAVRHAASKDETRHTLTGVYISQNCNTAEAAATDGRILLRARWQTGNAEKEYPVIPNEPIDIDEKAASGILPREAVDNLVSSLPKKKHLPILSFVKLLWQKDRRATVITTGGVETANITPLKLVDGSYPNYELVMLKKENVNITLRFAVSELKKLLAVLKEAGAETVTFGIKDDSSQVAIEAISPDNTVIDGAIMPIKGRR